MSKGSLLSRSNPNSEKRRCSPPDEGGSEHLGKNSIPRFRHAQLTHKLFVIGRAGKIQQKHYSVFHRNFALRIPSPSNTSYFLPSMRVL
jgi:hypothetical protein